jgi:hypothetical protein
MDMFLHDLDKLLRVAATNCCTDEKADHGTLSDEPFMHD